MPASAFSQGQDKTEDPTPHRLREARRQGQVARSAELISAANLIAMLLAGLLLSPWLTGHLMTFFVGSFGQLEMIPAGAFSAGAILLSGAMLYLLLMAPLFGTAAAVGLAANLAQVGFNFSFSRLTPQWGRLNPAQGFRRLFSPRALFELAKAVLKLVIVGTVTFYHVRGRLPAALLLLGQEPTYSLRFIGSVMEGLGVRVGLLFLALALLDYLFQRHDHLQGLRMSRQEVKDELRQLEGDPLIRSRLREKQRILARQRMAREVPTADVIITNPTALAIALRYRPDRDPAPRVIAKGAGLVAQKIRQIAKEHQVMVVENPPVAQALFKSTDIGQVIPAELYQAVAEILAMIYRIKDEKEGADNFGL